MGNIRQIAYAKYKHDWMVRHGINERYMDDIIAEYMADYISCEQTFSEWLFENGFHGALWVCFEEFLGAEYRDREDMRSLLTDNEYIVYLHDNLT